MWVPARLGGCRCPPRARRAPVPTRPPLWLARPGRTWAPRGTVLALVPCHTPGWRRAWHRFGHRAAPRPVSGSAPPALPASGCSGAGLGCSGAQGYGEGAESMDGATAEDSKHRAGCPSPTVPQFPQPLLGPALPRVPPAVPLPMPKPPLSPLPAAGCKPTVPAAAAASAAARGRERRRCRRAQLGLCPPAGSPGGFGARCQTVPVPPREGMGRGPRHVVPGRHGGGCGQQGGRGLSKHLLFL